MPEEDNHFMWGGDDVEITNPPEDEDTGAELQKEIDKVDALLKASGYVEGSDIEDDDDDEEED